MQWKVNECLRLELFVFIMQVIAVKKQIEDTQGRELFPCAQQLLIHQGKVLKDETTMDDNKVSENGFLVVMLTKVRSLSTNGFYHFAPCLLVFS